PNARPLQGSLGKLEDIPRVLDSATPYVLNLALERPRLIEKISEIGTQTAELSLTSVTPDSFARVLRQTPAQPATKSRSVTAPAAGGLFAGLALGIAAAVAMD